MRRRNRLRACVATVLLCGALTSGCTRGFADGFRGGVEQGTLTGVSTVIGTILTTTAIAILGLEAPASTGGFPGA